MQEIRSSNPPVATGICDLNKYLLNIFSKAISPNFMSENVTLSITDHFPKFFITSNILLNPPSSKSPYKRDWTRCGQENFIFYYFSIKWDQKLRVDSNDIDKIL